MIHTGQDGADLDKGLADSAVGQDSAGPVLRVRLTDSGWGCDGTSRQVPGCCLAGVLVAGGQHTRRELWRRQGYALEGEPEGCLGMRERHDELSDCRFSPNCVCTWTVYNYS